MIEALRRRKEVGAIAASGRYLANAITSPIGSNGHVDCVLEVGAGMGAFTHHILHRLGPDGQADIVELNPRFCDKLREDVVEPWAKQNRDRSATVIEGCIEDAALKPKYTTIVCGLPFNSFSPDVAERILQQLINLLAPSGTLAFFEYAGLPSLRCAFPGPWRHNAREHRRCLQELTGSMVQQRQFIFRNILPAWAVFLRAEGA